MTSYVTKDQADRLHLAAEKIIGPADPDRVPSVIEIVADLRRATAVFQLRTIELIIRSGP